MASDSRDQQLRNDSAQRISLKRLLLAKQLYMHALEHSRTDAALDKMISIHNFHNSIEITLRAILLHHEIRLERELSLDFESLMNQIDQYSIFRSQEKRLPYRLELRRLNTVRNLVQHHAHEPEESSMEEWRVFTERFLSRTFKEYFDENFDNLTSLIFINDERLRNLLECAEDRLSDGKLDRALCANRLAFTYAMSGLHMHHADLGLNARSLTSGRLKTGVLELDGVINHILEAIQNRIMASERYSMLLASGVNAVQWARYMSMPVSIAITLGGETSF